MKSNKCKLLASSFCLVIMALALMLPNMAFALQSGDFAYMESGGTVTITGYSCPGRAAVIPPVIDGKPVIKIGYKAFANCTSLISVTIPNSVTKIGVLAFNGCSGLTSMTIGNGVTGIMRGAFQGCSGLTNVTIPNGVTSIGNHAFDGCSSLSSVIVPKSVTNIGRGAFGSLTSIVIDANNATYSSQDGVLYNKAKTILIKYPAGKSGGEFIIPNGVITIEDSAFNSCSWLLSVTIPNSVISIGDFAFYHCVLTNVTIGNSVTHIGKYAFASCTNLTTVTIPASVTSIGDEAFDGCIGLTTAYFKGNAPTMGSDVFWHCAGNLTICYTTGSTGFTNPWCFFNQFSPERYCYPARVCGETSSTTTVSADQNAAKATTTTFLDATHCTDITKVDFKNTIINRKSFGALLFKNGVCEDFDSKHYISDVCTLTPEPSQIIRFIIVASVALDRPGEWDSLIGFKCENGTIKKVFEQQLGEYGMYVQKLGERQLSLKFTEMAKNDARSNPSKERIAIFQWSSKDQTFSLVSEKIQNKPQP